MLICGIVAEYNPFHNGHLYHIAGTREQGATHIVAVMSGNFTQRAEPAVINKFERARAAALAGVDLVVELPLCYATAASERFARGAVSLLDAMGCVGMLSFGSECGDVAALTRAASAVDDPKVRRRIKQLTELGESYPAAQSKALQVFYPDISELSKAPNNILGIDYIRAVSNIKSGIRPVTVTRRGAAHDSEEASCGFASAGYIRGVLQNRGSLAPFVPRDSELSLLEATVSGGISGGLKAVESAVLMKLRAMTREEFAMLPDAAGGVGDRLFSAGAEAGTIEELYALGKTRRYTMSRIRRAVLAAFLGITADDYIDIPYVRLLAIGERGSDILREMKKKCALPVSGSLRELASLGGLASETARKEAAATDIFGLTLRKRAPGGMDFKTKLFSMQP